MKVDSGCEASLITFLVLKRRELERQIMDDRQNSNVDMNDSSSTESESPIYQSVKEQRPEGGYEQPSGTANAGVAIALLLFIGIVIAGAGIGMSDTTQVDKQACIEEDYSGECTEYGTVNYQESEQNPMKPLAIGIGGIMIIGAIVVYGVMD